MKSNKILIQKSDRQRGVSIYLALLIMSVLLAIVFGLDAILVGQMKTVREIGYSVVAFYASETGIEKALHNSACTSTCAFGPDSFSLDFGDSSFDANYIVTGSLGGTPGCSASASYCIKSVGTFQNTKRAIQVSR